MPSPTIPGTTPASAADAEDRRRGGGACRHRSARYEPAVPLLYGFGRLFTAMVFVMIVAEVLRA